MKLDELDEGFMFGKSAKEDLMSKVERLANLVKSRTEELNAAKERIREMEDQIERLYQHRARKANQHDFVVSSDRSDS